MKMTTKILSLLGALVLGAFQAGAQVVASGTLTAATNNLIVTGTAQILSLTLYDTSGTNNAIVVYDSADVTSTNLIRPAYTAAGRYLTNRITTYTSANGTTVTYTNSVLYPYTTSVAATTNEANRILYTIVNASDSFSSPPGLPLGVTRGVLVRPANAGSYTIQYVPAGN